MNIPKSQLTKTGESIKNDKHVRNRNQIVRYYPLIRKKIKTAVKVDTKSTFSKFCQTYSQLFRDIKQYTFHEYC